MPRPQATRANPYTPKSGKLAGQTFTSERQYRNALARGKGFTNWDAQRRSYRATGSRSSLEKLRPAQWEKRGQALHVLSLMRRGHLNLGQAIRAHNRGNPAEHISREAAMRYIEPALEKRGGRLFAKPHDRLLRIMKFPTTTGWIAIEVRDSRSASRIGRYLSAVATFRDTGDESPLREFRGKFVRSGKVSYPFITDPATLKRLARAGELHLDSIYEQFGTR